MPSRWDSVVYRNNHRIYLKCRPPGTQDGAICTFHTASKAGIHGSFSTAHNEDQQEFLQSGKHPLWIPASPPHQTVSGLAKTTVAGMTIR